MDKPLSDIKKDNVVDDKSKDVKSQDFAPVAQSASPSAAPNSATNSGDVTAYNPELSYQNWQDSLKNQRWDSSPQGRAAIRFFSRGGLGSVAFAAGGWYVGRGMGMQGYKPTLKFTEINPTKPLQYVAKSIDTFFGKPLQFTAKMFGVSEEKVANLVRFRPTNYLGNLGVGESGRSLGHESVNVTFDFFSMSMADAAGRDIANIIDPHVKHDWVDDKGHIKFGQAAKNVGSALWRYVSYNGGEDWAVAVPYVYYLRAQRNLINKISPGFAIDSDRNLNGGSFKIDKSGKVIGNYHLEGMLDLQGRFTAYNVGTLMFRELYNLADDKIHGKNVVLYGSLDDPANQKGGVLHDVGNVAKWVARSTVKGVVYMTASVPFFHIFRTPQTKYRGLFINPEDGSALSYEKNGKYEMLHANEVGGSGIQSVRFRKIGEDGIGNFKGGALSNHPLSQPFAPYEQKEGSYVLNKIGQGQNWVRSRASTLPAKFGLTTPSPQSMSTFTNAAFSYYPYMYAKGEGAIWFDSGKTDAAAERMIDGAASLNWKEFKAGGSELWRSFLHKPFTDPAREAYSIKRIAEDDSPPDYLTKEQAKFDTLQDISESPISWKERIVQGRAPEKSKVEKPKSSHADQEYMRKILAELQPPTNSIH